MNRFRHLLCVTAIGCAALSLAIGVALAQSASPPAPAAGARNAQQPLPKLEPLPEGADTELEPQVTITRREGETVEEARVNGKLMWVKVTPSHGRPYFLIPDAGGHTYIRRDSLDSGLKVPLWVLFTF
jgi:hypothetical protein